MIPESFKKVISDKEKRMVERFGVKSVSLGATPASQKALI